MTRENINVRPVQQGNFPWATSLGGSLCNTEKSFLCLAEGPMKVCLKDTAGGNKLWKLVWRRILFTLTAECCMESGWHTVVLGHYEWD